MLPLPADSTHIINCNFLLTLLYSWSGFFVILIRSASIIVIVIFNMNYYWSSVVNLPSPTKDMAITMSMETPEIILIEDQMDPASNSLLLSVCIEPDILCIYQLSTARCMYWTRYLYTSGCQLFKYSVHVLN